MNIKKQTDMKMYTEKQVVKLLAEFGTHVTEQCLGQKLNIYGELFKWCETKMPSVKIKL